MDIEAEMRKLQEEARREIAQRDAADAEAAELPPTPIPAEVKRAAKQESKAKKTAEAKRAEADQASGMLEKASAALTAAKAANDLAQRFDPDVLSEAKQLADKATDVEKMSLVSKVGLAAGGLVAFAILWELLLGPIILGLAGLAIIVLIIVGVLKLAGFGKDDPDEDDPEA